MIIALTRTPGPTLAHCELTYIAGETIDLERALRQHQAYREALTQVGVRVLVLPTEPELPDSVFVEDTAVVLDEMAVIASFARPSRQPETEVIAPVIRKYLPILRILPPATIEGGDVLRVGRTLYVGLSSRTNAAGVDALRHAVTPHGYQVVNVPIRGCLHLKTGCASVDDDAVLVNPDWVDPARFSDCRILSVDPGEPWAANVLRIGSTLLMNAACPVTAGMIKQYGYRVRTVDISEFAKAEAGLTCMSLLFSEPG